MRRHFLVLGLVLALTSLGAAAVPTTAYADSTCYTGCTNPVTGNSTAPVTVAPQVTTPPIAPEAASSSGGLAFTGADIAGMVAIGAGALVVGGLMVRRSRRRHRAAT